MSERDLLILYATETGTAQDIAEPQTNIHWYSIISNVLEPPFNVGQSDLISETLVLFVVSTTGSGVEPRSMTSMWKTLLRGDLPADLFDDLSFAVFGLGDTAYEKFCWPAKKLARRLVNLGATEICDRGEGDDQDPLGIDGALESWVENFSQVLLRIYPLPDNLEIIPAAAMPAARVNMFEDASLATPVSPPAISGFYLATVKCNNRITAEDWYQDVRHFEFNFDQDIQFSPGDVAVIRPLAFPSDVELFLSEMNWLDVADVPFRVKHTMSDQSLPEHLPEVVTPRTLFTHYLDFNAIPRRSFFGYLCHFTTDELERERLDEFLSREGADDLYDYCYRVRRTIREVLSEFRHVKIPMEYIFDVFPPLRPRQFSIASSVKRFPSQIHLCVAIVKYRTKLKIPRKGVCTSFLASLKPGDKVEIGLQQGFLKLPADNNTPVICIGPGTGVAPMRAVIQERLQVGATDNTLYFGCRSASKDQHYGAEWRSSASTSDLTYRTAFSRDGPEGVKRIYVQDLLQEDAERIWTLMQAGASVFISGSSNKMPAAVKGALRFAAETYGKLEASEATEFVSAMEARGQLIEECWS
ncbi:NADPH-dependent diflavin oxidoreductase 1 [Mycena sanguinolenta]|uniref:NADPH-dependent diflavin oxidoreductase 1 n=1 Tax=Mycena sanguinolenta TaxID=230812 RepID=A0A8H7DI33_9AGAR|nr:NADPH-dependent diflavin oxidoreductase 1 [Mycena sanguinolenta]